MGKLPSVADSLRSSQSFFVPGSIKSLPAFIMLVLFLPPYQSVITSPSKLHSFLKTLVRSLLFSAAYVPFILL